jgi:hypothetical protein
MTITNAMMGDAVNNCIRGSIAGNCIKPGCPSEEIPPAPCVCPETKCVQYLIGCHVKREYFDKSAANCLGVLDHTDEFDIGVGVVANFDVDHYLCEWVAAYAYPGRSDSTTPDADGGYASLDPLIVNVIELQTSEPCFWGLDVLVVSDQPIPGSGTILATGSFTGTTPATADGAAYPDIVFCVEQTSFWVKTTFSLFTVVCDD